MNTRILLILCGIVLLACPVWADDVVAEFTDGNDNEFYVDAFHGIAGDGWTTPWEEHDNKTDPENPDPTDPTITTTVVDVPPGTEVYSGGGSYLSATMDSNAEDTRYSVSREHGDIGGNTPRRIEFYFRLDDDLSTFGVGGANPAADRYQLFDGNANRTVAGWNATWLINAYSVAGGNCPEGCQMEWSFVNGINSSSGSMPPLPGGCVNTDVPLVSGAVYYFSINLHTTVGTWDGYVTTTIGETTYTYDSLVDYPTGMGWRCNAVHGDYLYFSSRASAADDVRAFSLDGVRISEIPNIPPPCDMDTVEAHFTEGNTVLEVDGFPGMAGDGWRDEWQYRLRAGITNGTATVVETSPLKPGEGSGKYLSVNTEHPYQAEDPTAATYSGVTRSYKAYDHGICWDREHTIQFSVRIDEDLSGDFDNVDDRYEFSEIDNGYNPDDSSTWLVACFGGSNEGAEQVIANPEDVGVWVFYDGGRDGGARDAELNVASDIAVVTGQVYDFTIVVDPETQSYVGTVSDGTDSFTTGTLGWRTDSTGIGGWLDFSTRAGEILGEFYPEYRMFSLDDVVITQIAEEPVPGDANNDGHVDGLDAARLAENWGATTLNPTYDTWWEMGDFDDDEFVGPKDAAIMAANWGFPGEEGTQGVPEPCTAMLMVVGLAILAMRRTRG